MKQDSVWHRRKLSVLSADVCLSVCLSSVVCVCVCVCIPALSLVSFLLFSGVSVNRQMVVGAIDESRPGLHSGRLRRPYNK